MKKLIFRVALVCLAGFELSFAQSGGTVGTDSYFRTQSAAITSNVSCLSICNGAALNNAGSEMIAHVVAQTFFNPKFEKCNPITESSPLFECQRLRNRALGPHMTRQLKQLRVDGKRYCAPTITPGMAMDAADASSFVDRETGRKTSPIFGDFVEELKHRVAQQVCGN